MSRGIKESCFNQSIMKYERTINFLNSFTVKTDFDNNFGCLSVFLTSRGFSRIWNQECLISLSTIEYIVVIGISKAVIKKNI